jgi:hypothetical protein
MATPFRTLLAMTILLAAAPPVLSETRLDEASLPVGSYAITTRLELPHLERWAIDKTTTICLSGHAAGGQIPIPILSENNPYATCAAAKSRDRSRQAGIRCPLPWPRLREGACDVFARSGPFRRPRGHGAGRKEHDNGGNTARPTHRRLQLPAPGNGDRILNWRAIPHPAGVSWAAPQTGFRAFLQTPLRNAVKSSKFNYLLAFTLPCRTPIFVPHQTA